MVNDQRGCPTYSVDLARAIIKLCRDHATGIVHATNAGDCSWFEFAHEIVKRAGLATEVRPVSSQQMARPAPRPAYSVLSAKSLQPYGIEIPAWQDALARYLRERKDPSVASSDITLLRCGGVLPIEVHPELHRRTVRRREARVRRRESSGRQRDRAGCGSRRGLVDDAVQAARKALRGEWGRLTVRERAARLHKVADAIDARFDCFVAAEVADTGKPVTLASRLDVPRAAANFRVFADLIKTAGLESFQTETPDGKSALNYAVRKPLGVVGIITPWNLPLLLLTWKVAPALACGNTVVVKPSEETPTTATLLAEVMQDAGIPRGVYNVVHGFGPNSAGEFLTQHNDVNAVTFTGESQTGAAIMKSGCAIGQACLF